VTHPVPEMEALQTAGLSDRVPEKS
jgi:hypothetical protein